MQFNIIICQYLGTSEMKKTGRFRLSSDLDLLLAREGIWTKSVRGTPKMEQHPNQLTTNYRKEHFCKNFTKANGKLK